MKGKYVFLTPITLSDLQVMCEWINDREQVLFNAPYKPVTSEQHAEWFKDLQKRNDVLIFAVRLIENNKFIGTCQLNGINYTHRSADLQIRLGKEDDRGHGYGTEAVKLLVNFAFLDLNLQRVQLHVFNNNLRAIRAYQKVGFIEEGVLRKAAYIDGKYIDVLIMGVLKEDYVK